MEYLVKYGRPDLALAQYRHCQQVLAREFGTQPLPETQRLYQQILKEGDGAQVSGQGCN
jgi:DNA-binding SARP family transcriptional activator